LYKKINPTSWCPSMSGATTSDSGLVCITAALTLKLMAVVTHNNKQLVTNFCRLVVMAFE